MTESHTPGDTPDDTLEQLLAELELPLPSIREHRDYFERIAAGDHDGVSEDAPALARFALAIADGETPRPADIAAVDKWGETDGDGEFIKRKLAAAGGARRRPPDGPAERLWSFVSRRAEQVNIEQGDSAASRRVER